MDTEVLNTLWHAGVRSIFFGLESAAPSVLHRIRKAGGKGSGNKLTKEERFLQRLKESVIKAKAIGFDLSLSVIFGLPGETLEDAHKTIAMIEELDIPYAHNLLQVYRGTQLWQERKQYNIRCQPFSKKWQIPMNTIPAYDITKVPRLNQKDGAHSTMHKYEIQAVIETLLGTHTSPAEIPFPMLIRAPQDAHVIGNYLKNYSEFGSRLILCDGILNNFGDQIEEYVFPTSSPIFLSKVDDERASAGGLRLKRQSPILDAEKLSFEIHLKNLSHLLAFNNEGDIEGIQTTHSSQSRRWPKVNVIILGEIDFELLMSIGHRLLAGDELGIILGNWIGHTVFADRDYITGSLNKIKRRKYLLRNGQITETVSSVFNELRPLVDEGVGICAEIAKTVWALSIFCKLFRKADIPDFEGKRCIIRASNQESINVIDGMVDNYRFLGCDNFAVWRHVDDG